MRTFLLYGLNTAPAGKAFDGFLANGGRRIPRRVPSGLRSRLGRHVQRRDGASPVLVVRTDGAIRDRRQGVRPERRERVLRDDGLHDPPWPSARGRAGLRLPPRRPWRRRAGDLGTCASSRLRRRWKSGRRKGRSRPKAGCSSWRGAKALGPNICPPSRPSSRRPTIWTSPGAACGCRRWKCPSSGTPPSMGRAQGRAAGQGRVGPAVRHARRLPQEGVGSGGSARPGPVPAGVGTGEVRRRCRESQLVRIRLPGSSRTGTFTVSDGSSRVVLPVFFLGALPVIL